MEWFAGQDPRSYSLYFDLNIWFRARKVTGTFEKRAPGPLLKRLKSTNALRVKDTGSELGFLVVYLEPERFDIVRKYCARERSVTSLYHGSKISGSQRLGA